jgi:hypothetical protein
MSFILLAPIDWHLFPTYFKIKFWLSAKGLLRTPKEHRIQKEGGGYEEVSRLQGKCDLPKHNGGLIRELELNFNKGDR